MKRAEGSARWNLADRLTVDQVRLIGMRSMSNLSQWLLRARLLLPATRVVAVLGGFRSGTNYVRYLLERNYWCRVSYNGYGWKHGGIPIFNDISRLKYPNYPIVYIAKNPHSFCASLYAYYVKQHRNISAPLEWSRFLRQPFTIFDTDPATSPQMRFSNPVQYWNYLYWNLVSLPADRFLARGLRYEDALTDPERAIAPVADALGLSRRNHVFDTPDGELHRMSDTRYSRRNPYTLSPQSFDKTKYENKLYLDRYTPDEFAFVAEQTDPSVLAALDYTVDEKPS